MGMRKIALCFLAMAVLPIVANAQSVVATLPVAGNPFRIAITPDGLHAYVLLTNSNNAGNCLISVINTATNTVFDTPLPGINNCPEGISIAPNNTYAYVTGGGNQLSVVDTATTSAVTAVTVGISQAIATTPNSSYVYVGNSGNGAVSVVSTAANNVVATVPVGASFSNNITPTPDNPIVITPNGAFVYVATNKGTVSVISTATNSIVATIPVNSDINLTINDPIAITPNGAYIYVGNILGNSVSAIDTATNTVAATIPIGGSPTAIAASPDGSYVYVPASNATSVISTATNSVVATIPVVATALAITPNAAYVYMSSSSGVSVVSTATNMVAATVPIGFLPSDVAIAPNGKFAYVANYGDRTVSVVSVPPPPQPPLAAPANSRWMLVSLMALLCLLAMFQAAKPGSESEVSPRLSE